MRRVWGELRASVCTVGVLALLTLLTSFVLGRVVAPALDAAVVLVLFAWRQPSVDTERLKGLSPQVLVFQQQGGARQVQALQDGAMVRMRSATRVVTSWMGIAIGVGHGTRATRGVGETGGAMA